MQARYVSHQWENQAHTIMSFYFEPAGTYSYQAGQYADITIPCSAPDQRGITRTMTFSSSPHDKLLRISTRIGSANVSTYKQTLLALELGATVALTDAMGDMILPLDASVPLVFVAGGVGIASYAGIMNCLLYDQEKRDVTLLYATASVADMAFQKVFDDYAEFYSLTRRIYTPAVNTANGNNEELVFRRLTAQDIADAMKPDAQVYLTGSMAMVESLRSELQSTFNVPQYQIAFDYFDGYVEA